MTSQCEALSLFETPVFKFHVEGMEPLNEVLRTLLLEEREGEPGLVRSNRGGWHSRPTLTQREDPAWVALTQMVQEHMAHSMLMLQRKHQQPARSWRWALEGWAMIMERGDYALLHDHAPADWSAVWYVDAGEEGSGQLDMVHPGRPPGGALVDLFPSLASFTPVSGMLLVFPGFLQHYVHPYQGETPRISVSMNARVVPQV